MDEKAFGRRGVLWCTYGVVTILYDGDCDIWYELFTMMHEFNSPSVARAGLTQCPSNAASVFLELAHCHSSGRSGLESCRDETLQYVRVILTTALVDHSTVLCYRYTPVVRIIILYHFRTDIQCPRRLSTSTTAT